MIEGVLILLAGWLIGHATGRRAKKPGQVQAQPSPTSCHSCHHGRGYHENGTGVCQAVVEYVWDTNTQGYRPHPCTCQLYDGPEPLPEYYHPEAR